MKQYNWQAQKLKMMWFTVFYRHILRNDAIHAVLQAYFKFLQALSKEMTQFMLFCRHNLGFCRHFFVAIHGVSQAHFWWLKKLTGTFFFSAPLYIYIYIYIYIYTACWAYMQYLYFWIIQILMVEIFCQNIEDTQGTIVQIYCHW